MITEQNYKMAKTNKKASKCRQLRFGKTKCHQFSRNDDFNRGHNGYFKYWD